MQAPARGQTAGIEIFMDMKGLTIEGGTKEQADSKKK
jgi:hypothetical protein